MKIIVIIQFANNDNVLLRAMWWLLLVGVLLILLRVYYQNVYNFWRSRKVPTPQYKYLFGNMGSAIILKKSLGEIFTDMYNKFDGLNYVGFYQFTKPGLVLLNPEIIKDVMSKNFYSFHDNDVNIDEKVDLIFGKNPFSLKGERWKTVRAQITPCFSASKLKAMMPLLQDSARKMLKYLEEEPKSRNGDGLEAKELSSKYTCENIASCAFGLEGRSFTDSNAEFRQQGVKLMTPSFWNGIITFIVMMFPTFSKIFKIKFTPDDVTNFFKQIVSQTIQYRKSNNVKRNDFLEFMSDLMTKINNEKDFNYDDITAHAGGFFVDGFETSSVVISYTFYELAANLEIQDKLRQEIRDVKKRHGNELTYEAILEMEYLDCVLKESLRKNGPVLSLGKVCTQTYKLPPVDESKSGSNLTIEPGTSIVIPVEGLHKNPKFFPEPERFLPERFDDNGKNIIKGTYIPFGEGPRMCLGQKFALLQSKLGIATIINDYEIKVNKKTKEPLVLDSKYFLRAPVGGIWLDFKKIN